MAGAARVWSLGTSTELWRWAGPLERISEAALRRYSGFGKLTFSPDSSQLAVAHATGQVYLLDVQTGRTRRVLGSQMRVPLSVVFSDDDRLVVSMEWLARGPTRSGRTWDLSQGRPVPLDRLDSYALAKMGRVKRPKPDEQLEISHADGSRAIVGTKKFYETPRGFMYDYEIQVFDAEGELVQTIEFLGRLLFAAVGPGGESMVVNDDGTATLWRKGEAQRLGTGMAQFLGGRRSRSVPRTIVINSLGTFAATVHLDDGVRLWDLKTGRQRATLLDFHDDEWAIVADTGHYTGTSEVGDRIGWVYDNPSEQFGFARFDAEARSPAKVRSRLQGQDVSALPPRYRPPAVEIVEAPRVGEDGKALLRVRASSRGRVDRVRVFVEGKPVATELVCASQSDSSFSVPLFDGANRVTAVAFDWQGGSSNPASVSVRGQGSVRKADLWVVAIGVNEYPNLPRAMWLGAARQDATALADHFSKHGKQRFRRVHRTLLTEDKVTPRNIEKALDGLKQMARDDVAIVFFAGHGFKPTDEDDSVFAASGFRMSPSGKRFDQTSLREDAIGWSDISTRLGRARGRVLVLLDACHSGHLTQELVVPNAALARQLTADDRAGAIVFAASKGRQLSFEPNLARGLVLEGDAAARVGQTFEVPHGFFTGALLRALTEGATDRDGDGWLQVSELIDSVTTRVSSATRGAQTPWVVRRELFGDFAIGRAPR